MPHHSAQPDRSNRRFGGPLQVHNWFIGDVHGCYDKLRRLEDRAASRSSREGSQPRFISVGDMVDRGPDSAAVVRRFRLGSADGTHAAILGNHEDSMLRVLYDLDPRRFADTPLAPWITVGAAHRMSSPRAGWLSIAEFNELNRLNWLSQGGYATLQSWNCDPGDARTWNIDEDDLAWLAALPLLIETDYAVATHGLASGLSLDAVARFQHAAAQAPSGARADPRMLGVFQAVLWSRRLPSSRPLDDKMHVSGHTPLSRLRRYRDRGLVRADTGACYGGALSAWCPELDESISVN